MTPDEKRKYIADQNKKAQAAKSRPAKSSDDEKRIRDAKRRGGQTSKGMHPTLPIRPPAQVTHTIGRSDSHHGMNTSDRRPGHDSRKRPRRRQ